MPEMPELEVLRGFLAPRLRERLISDVSISPRFGFLLRTPVDELRARLTGETINGISRRGKFLLLDLASNRLVINPMLGGRLHWQPAVAKPPPNAIFGIELDDGNRLHLSDFARMARVYLVAAGQLDGVPGWNELGPEALGLDLDEFRQRIRRHPGGLKDLLRNQAFIAGIGNAYADEILHAAAFLPLRRRTTLDGDDIVKLHGAVQDVLGGALQRIRDQPEWEPHKQDRSFMAVHMKGGEACPRCGHRISELTARGEITNFCRGCQY